MTRRALVTLAVIFAILTVGAVEMGPEHMAGWTRLAVAFWGITCFCFGLFLEKRK